MSVLATPIKEPVNADHVASLKALGFKVLPHSSWPVLRMPSEKVAEIGESIYQSRLKTQLEPKNDGRIVAIDVETEDYEVADTTIEALRQLADRQPNAQVWIERIGCRAACIIR